MTAEVGAGVATTMNSMTWRRRRRGVFERLPRVLYRRSGARYVDACAWAIVLNGIVVAGFGVATLALNVDLSAAELILVGVSWAAGYAVEGLVAAVYFRRAALPARAWLASEDGEPSQAWAATARLPVALLRRPSLYAIGAVGAAAPGLTLVAALGLPAYESALLFPASYLLYASSVVWLSTWRCDRCSRSAPLSRCGSASCLPTRCRARSSTCAAQLAESAPAISACACR